mmetsp:Transcript_46662/g.151619  ORF Transcript_46662/g.151619 Transcript_46662/m.151619 type:complete len:204 (+) Transcript_46662:102-713(+)
MTPASLRSGRPAVRGLSSRGVCLHTSDRGVEAHPLAHPVAAALRLFVTAAARRRRGPLDAAPQILELDARHACARRQHRNRRARQRDLRHALLGGPDSRAERAHTLDRPRVAEALEGARRGVRRLGGHRGGGGGAAHLVAQLEQLVESRLCYGLCVRARLQHRRRLPLLLDWPPRHMCPLVTTQHQGGRTQRRNRRALLPAAA